MRAGILLAISLMDQYAQEERDCGTEVLGIKATLFLFGRRWFRPGGVPDIPRELDCSWADLDDCFTAGFEHEVSRHLELARFNDEDWLDEIRHLISTAVPDLAAAPSLANHMTKFADYVYYYGRKYQDDLLDECIEALRFLVEERAVISVLTEPRVSHLHIELPARALSLDIPLGPQYPATSVVLVEWALAQKARLAAESGL
jgi:hypothetical protein